MKSRVALTLSFIAAFATVSLAQGQRRGNSDDQKSENGVPPRIEILAKVLNLTDAQVAAIEKVFQSHEAQIKALQQDVKDKREALKAAATAANPDPATVGRAFLALRTSMENLRNARKQVMTAIDNILTPDQQKILTALRTLRKLMRERRAAGGGLGMEDLLGQEG